MFYQRIAFKDDNNNLFVYKLPDSLTDSQIDWYFNNYLNLTGEWSKVNDVKIHRRLSVARYKTLFLSEEFSKEIKEIKEYFESYDCREAIWVQMKSFGCKYLFSKGLIMNDISAIMGYKNHTSVIYFVKNYKDFYKQLKYEDFMSYVRNKKYPKFENGKLKMINL